MDENIKENTGMVNMTNDNTVLNDVRIKNKLKKVDFDFGISTVPGGSNTNNKDSIHLTTLHNYDKKEYYNNPEEKQSWLSKHYNSHNSLIMFIIFGLCFCVCAFAIGMIGVTKADKSIAFLFAPGALVSFVGASVTYCCPGPDEPYSTTGHRTDV